MEKKADYTVVGIFVVCLSVCLVSFFFWLTARKHDVEYKTYAIYTNEDVTGLSKQSPVRFNGVIVGFVNAITLDKQNPQLVVITLQLLEGSPISTSTYATLNTQGITGLLYVGLKAGTKKGVPLQAQPGQAFPVIPVEKSILAQITNVIPTIASSVTQAGKTIQQLFSLKNRQYVEQTLVNIQHFTDIMSHSSAELSESITRLNETLTHTAVASKRLPAVMKQLQRSLKDIALTAKEMKSASHAVRDTAKSSEFLINNLNQQTLPNLHQTMSSFNSTMSNLSQLSAQLARNPSQLVRGRAAPQPGPGEK